MSPLPPDGHRATVSAGASATARSSTRRRSASINGGGGIQITAYAQPGQRPERRLWELGRVIELLEARTRVGGIFEAHLELTGALDAIYALNGSGIKLRGWPAEQRKVLQGVLGARNAAHHAAGRSQEHPSVAVMWNEPGEGRLKWHIDDPTVIRSPRQRAAYCEYVEGEPVIAQLRALLALLAPPETATV